MENAFKPPMLTEINSKLARTPISIEEQTI